MSEGEENEFINENIVLKLLLKDGTVELFRMKILTSMRKLKLAYCHRTGSSMVGLHLRFKGKPILDIDTPFALELKMEDEIEVYHDQQTGDH